MIQIEDFPKELQQDFKALIEWAETRDGIDRTPPPVFAWLQDPRGFGFQPKSSYYQVFLLHLAATLKHEPLVMYCSDIAPLLGFRRNTIVKCIEFLVKRRYLWLLGEKKSTYAKPYKIYLVNLDILLQKICRTKVYDLDPEQLQHICSSEGHTIPSDKETLSEEGRFFLESALEMKPDCVGNGWMEKTVKAVIDAENTVGIQALAWGWKNFSESRKSRSLKAYLCSFSREMVMGFTSGSSYRPHVVCAVSDEKQRREKLVEALRSYQSNKPKLTASAHANRTSAPFANFKRQKQTQSLVGAVAAKQKLSLNSTQDLMSGALNKVLEGGSVTNPTQSPIRREVPLSFYRQAFEEKVSSRTASFFSDNPPTTQTYSGAFLQDYSEADARCEEPKMDEELLEYYDSMYGPGPETPRYNNYPYNNDYQDLLAQPAKPHASEEGLLMQQNSNTSYSAQRRPMQQNSPLSRPAYFVPTWSNGQSDIYVGVAYDEIVGWYEVKDGPGRYDYQNPPIPEQNREVVKETKSLVHERSLQNDTHTLLSQESQTSHNSNTALPSTSSVGDTNNTDGLPEGATLHYLKDIRAWRWIYKEYSGIFKLPYNRNTRYDAIDYFLRLSKERKELFNPPPLPVGIEEFIANMDVSDTKKEQFRQSYRYSEYIKGLT